MNTTDAIKAFLTAQYPDYPVKVEHSPDDGRVLWVQVFAVPDDNIREVKDFVHDLEDTVFKDWMLLPMVKGIETTREHYPNVGKE